jgi:hypothetical protein
MLSIEIEHAEEFKSMVDSIWKICKDVAFKVASGKIMAQAMDHTHVSLVECNILHFKKFKSDRVYWLVITPNMTKKIKPGHIISMNSKTFKVFSGSTLVDSHKMEHHKDPYSIVHLDTSSFTTLDAVALDTKLFSDRIKTFYKFGAFSCDFYCGGNKQFYMTYCDDPDWKVTFELTPKNITSGTTESHTYGTRYILDFVKTITTDQITLFGVGDGDHPLTIRSNFHIGTLCFHLAPFIETE